MKDSFNCLIESLNRGFQKRNKKKQIDYVFCPGGGGLVRCGCDCGPGGSVGGSPVGSGKLKKKKY